MPRDEQTEKIKEKSRAKSPREAPAQAKAEPSTSMKDRSAKVDVEDDYDYEIGPGGVAPKLVEKKARGCAACGTELSANMMVCANCTMKATG